MRHIIPLPHEIEYRRVITISSWHGKSYKNQFLLKKLKDTIKKYGTH